MANTATARSAAAVYRAPMRSRDDDVPEGDAVERALTHGLCGIGGRLDPAPVSLVAALRAADRAHGERLARRIERFAAAPEGAFVWTRDGAGALWLGRLTGRWRYDSEADAEAVDLVHVRACDWLDAPIDDRSVPAEVRASFGRGGRNWQAIRAPGAVPATAALWAQYREAVEEGGQPRPCQGS